MAVIFTRERVVSACDGPLVSDGKIFSSSAGNAFGVTKSGEYVLGAFTESDVKNLGLTQVCLFCFGREIRFHVDRSW